MKINDILSSGEAAELAEAGAASRSLCKSSKPNSALGASALSSCKSQGLRRRTGKKKQKMTPNGKEQSVGGTKTKGEKYGGPLPNYDK